MKKGRKIFNRDERREILEKTAFRCAHCGKKLDEDTMTVEHIFPFSKGGDNSKFNLTTLCSDCNSEKSNFTYDVEHYYKYILPKYIDDYRRQFIRLRAKLIDSESIIGFTNKVYKIHPIERYQMIYSTQKRNKQLARKLYDQIAVNLKLERAYDGRAKAIVTFLNKCKDKYGSDIGIYNNEYIIMEHMRRGRVLTLANNLDEIYGVYIFVKAEYINTEFPQLNNFCEATGFSKVYVLTLAIANDKAMECHGEVMTDFFVSFISRKCTPIYFDIVGKNNNNTQYEIMQLPTELERHQGLLQFLSLKGIRNYLEKFFETAIERGDYTEEQVEKLINETLEPDTAFHNGDRYQMNWDGVSQNESK